MKKTYVILNLSSILLGLAVAIFYNKPGFIRYYIGDFLIIIFIFTFFKLIFKMKSLKALIITLSFAYIVEFFQTFNFIQNMSEKSTVSKIFLGSNFDWNDIITYTVSGLLIYLFDFYFSRRVKLK